MEISNLLLLLSSFLCLLMFKWIVCLGTPQFSSNPPPLVPLGERCQLCGIDLAFMVKGSDSRSDDPPFSAVLPCSHSYHDSCLRDVFGSVEPPCIRCSEAGAPQGSWTSAILKCYSFNQTSSNSFSILYTLGESSVQNFDNRMTGKAKGVIGRMVMQIIGIHTCE